MIVQPSMVSQTRQRGAALLLAMLIMAMVASLAAAATWQQWRNIQAETDERAQAQAQWLVRGALDWSKIILSVDGQFTRNDNLTEPWAVPVAEAKISTFLAAENNVAQNANVDMTEAFFAGGVEDLQGRLNLTNLVNGETLDLVAVNQFERLFEALGLPVEQADSMAQRYLASVQKEPEETDVPLSPACTAQLGWLGLDQNTVTRLLPYVTVLPERTRLNLNTAHELVLWAAMQGADQALAAKMASVRQFQPFESITAARQLMGDEAAISEGLFSVNTSYFLVKGQLRIEELESSAAYVVHRNGNRLSTVRRECPQAFGNVADPA